MNTSIGLLSIGLGATIIMDLWNVLLKRIFGIPSLNFCFLGRWIRHMPSGQYCHSNIAFSSEKSFECVVGWGVHYTIGFLFGLVFVLGSGDWISHPTLLPALAYGLGTVVFPFFILHPALGLGVASSKTKNPTSARLKSMVTHTVFGIGLFLTAYSLNYIVNTAS